MKKELRNNVVALSTILVASGSLFAYQNFVIPSKEASSSRIVYVARENLSRDTEIEANRNDQFTPIKVNGDSVIEGSVTDLSQVDGKYIEGGLLKGELLSTMRLKENTKEEGDYFVKVEPDFPVDIRDGEEVAVFVRGYNEGDGREQVVSLFDSKRATASSRVTNLLEGESTEGYYLRLTERELVDYYLAKNVGAIIFAKIVPNSVDVTEKIQAEGTIQDLAKIEKTEETEESEFQDGDVRYEVKEGDTFESIAHDLEISVETLKGANPGKDQATTGQFINIPQ